VRKTIVLDLFLFAMLLLSFDDRAACAWIHHHYKREGRSSQGALVSASVGVNKLVTLLYCRAY
jgi:hypothetical protein